MCGKRHCNFYNEIVASMISAKKTAAEDEEFVKTQASKKSKVSERCDKCFK